MRHIRKLKEILAYGFTPQAMSRVRQRPPNSRAEEDIEAAERVFAALAEGSVHGTDPRQRERMRKRALVYLLDDTRPLPPSLREWLAFVVGLAKSLPQQRRGRRPGTTTTAQIELLHRLAKFERNYYKRNPRALKKEFYYDAGKHFRKTARTIERALDRLRALSGRGSMSKWTAATRSLTSTLLDHFLSIDWQSIFVAPP